MRKIFLKRNPVEISSLLVAVGISIMLLVAAIGKMFYPDELWVGLDRTVAVLEVGWIVCLLRFYRFWQTWFLNALLFSTWAGYAFFWLLHDLPCGCMGKLISPPTALTFTFDLIFFLSSLLFLAIFTKKRTKVIPAAIVGVICMAGGFFIANAIFQRSTEHWEKTQNLPE